MESCPVQNFLEFCIPGGIPCDGFYLGFKVAVHKTSFMGILPKSSSLSKKQTNQSCYFFHPLQCFLSVSKRIYLLPDQTFRVAEPFFICCSASHEAFCLRILLQHKWTPRCSQRCGLNYLFFWFFSFYFLLEIFNCAVIGQYISSLFILVSCSDSFCVCVVREYVDRNIIVWKDVEAGNQDNSQP